MQELSGMYAALLTGFTDAGDFDPVRQQNIVDYAVRQDIAGLYVGGSSAEAALMSADDLLLQQNVVYERAHGRVSKLIAHVGQPNLRDTLHLARNAAELGYDALSALPPYAFPFDQDEIYGYYEAINEATDLPLIVYEIPVRTGTTTPLESITRILGLPNVAGIKFTSSDLYFLSRLKKSCPDATVFYGFDEMYGAAAALGVDGGIGTTYNIIGNLYAKIHSAVEASDLDRMRELQLISQDFVAAIKQVGIIPGVKKALELVGVDCGPPRAPLALRGEDPEAILRAVVDTPEFRTWTV